MTAPYLIVATEYGTVVTASPCDDIRDAERVRDYAYNAYAYHTQGSVSLLAYNDDEDEYLPCDWPEPDDGP